MKQYTYTLDGLASVAQKLLPLLERYPVMTFTGPLGAGKTTLIRQLMKLLGIPEQEITSPTFAYLNSYKRPSNQPVYHFDLYRIARAQDFIDAGFGEYLYEPESIAVIEWPEVIDELLGKDVCNVSIEYGTTADERVLTVDCVD